MFPTASSSVYYNDSGEVLGWDNTYYDEPDYDPYDADYHSADEDGLYGDLEACIAAGRHGMDADKKADGNWECYTCGEPCERDESDDEWPGMEDQWLDGSYEE